MDKIYKNFIRNSIYVKDLATLLKFKSTFLGKNSEIEKELRRVNSYNKEKQKSIGFKLNRYKSYILKFINMKREIISKNEMKPLIDIDPYISFNTSVGSKHVITQSIEKIKSFFISMNFEITEGYEIDSTYNNFDLLNIDSEHPSRSRKETFYLNKKILLRTHTSNMQIHMLKLQKPPMRIISIGKVYRRDLDSTHTPMFHQAEGFVIDKNISLRHLKYLIEKFLEDFFDTKIKYRIRTSFFPFTQPSLEIDIICMVCSGQKCTICKNSGWLEVLGCGMIHPKILLSHNIDSKYNGLAFGIGIERLCMLKYNIKDIRLFYENNINFLKQFDKI